MEFQVALMDSEFNYQVFFISADQSACDDYYQTQLDNNFSGEYTISPNTHSFNYLISRTYVENMTTEQQTGIDLLSSGCSQFCVLVSF